MADIPEKTTYLLREPQDLKEKKLFFDIVQRLFNYHYQTDQKFKNEVDKMIKTMPWSQENVIIDKVKDFYKALTENDLQIPDNLIVDIVKKSDNSVAIGFNLDIEYRNKAY